jgi:hypothetical protein
MRSQTTAIVYARILEHVTRDKSHLGADYLRAISPRLLELRRAYQTRNVTIDYGNAELVDAYLLGYYPHYIHTAADAFAAIPCEAFREFAAAGIRVLFIGGGPLPELVALVDRLLECGLPRARVYATRTPRTSAESSPRPWTFA